MHATVVAPTPSIHTASTAALPENNPWALSEGQRMELEINGYVVLPKLIDPSQVSEIREIMGVIEEDFRRNGRLPEGAFVSKTEQEIFRIDNLPHLHPCFHRYLSHSQIVSAVEEMIGGAARVEQSDAHIRRPNEVSDRHYAFHRGAFSGLAYTENNLYHFPFVKALTNLTDLGPDDGGTAVIPGSHKLPGSLVRATIAAALNCPSMIHRVIAPAGSTLLFYESLLHSSGIIRSGRERSLIIGGYTTTHFQAWAGYDPQPAFLERLDQDERKRYSGSERWQWRQKFRTIC
jgi:ectoine hydroxylase-related dioxygenase (phytanoyl-CoA dioxygenase family)